MSEVDIKQFQHYKENLAYAGQSKNQVMDILYPEAGGTPPLVVFIHGGGWVHGGKRDASIKEIFQIVSQGYALATVEYRLSSEALWPAQIFDVKAAVRCLRGRAKELGYDADRILAWGNSAGAHLCQMLAATADREELEDLSMGDPGESSAVQGLISWYGISNILTMDTQCGWTFHGAHPIDTWREDSHASLLLGCSVEKDPARTLSACPVTYVREDFPPSLFQHGTGDRIVPFFQSVEMVNRIAQVCGRDRAKLELFDGADHGDPVIKADANIRRCLRFLDDFYGFRRQGEVTLPEIRLI